MAIDHRIGNKVIKNLRREDATATRLEPYPYIGIVKNNLDPTRSGRLQVFFPDLGGNPDDSKNWRTVSYASPFIGATSHTQRDTDTPSLSNSFDEVAHTYGMWMVPPDIGVEVICIFIAGDPLRGYWISCVMSNLSHNMIPALAGSTNIEFQTAGDQTKSYMSGSQLPVAEFNENDPNLFLNSSFYNNPKPIHSYQYSILKKQGLDRDPTRGAISSSSQRETPSYVFGISTPGRPTNDPKDDPAYVKKLNDGTIGEEYHTVKTRKGGHTFVMDDGSVLGADQLIRLRTAGGHQILMHDTTKNLYICHAEGSSWIELTADGQIKIFAEEGFSVRSKGSLNLHSDLNVNIQADNNINMFATNKIRLEADNTTSILTGKFLVDAASKAAIKAGTFDVDVAGSISLLAEAGTLILDAAAGILQNSAAGRAVNDVEPMKTVAHSDSVYNSTLGVWVNKAQTMSSIVTVLPSHEPYYRPGAAVPVTADNSKPVDPLTKAQKTYDGKTDATKSLAGTKVTKPAGEEVLRNQPEPKEKIGPFSKEETKAFLAQLGHNESSSATPANEICPGNGLKLQNGQAGYNAVNQCGFIGKYQMGALALNDLGYVKSTVKNNSDLDNPNNWVGGTDAEGNARPANKAEFLANQQLQERAIEKHTNSNYKTLLHNGGITADMPKDEIAGMLFTAHLLGGGGANTWRRTGAGIDGNGTPGAKYFQNGKYAISQLAPKVAAINQG